MVVKEKRGRRRYVAYVLGRTVAKSELEEGIRSTGYSQIDIIQCAGGWCILRCEPWLLGRLDGIMEKACPGSVSKSTSGNLITLRHKYPILWDTRPRYIAFTVSADRETLSEGITERADSDGPSLKFCGSGYAIVKCTLRDREDEGYHERYRPVIQRLPLIVQVEGPEKGHRGQMSRTPFRFAPAQMSAYKSYIRD